MRQIFKKLVAKQLENYAQQLLNTHHPLIVGVTGSVGKTTTKLAIAHVLKSKYQVLVHEGNYNTEFGLPLSLFELEAPKNLSDVRAWLNIFKQMRAKIKGNYLCDVVVLEMGADKPGDIARFTRYIKPDIGVITAIARVHLEEFKDIEMVLKEKWRLATASKKIILNAQDELLRKQATETATQAVWYGLEDGDYNFSINSFEPPEGFRGKLQLKNQNLGLTMPVVGPQSIYALVAAAAVAENLSVKPEEIAKSIQTWQQPSGRMQLLKGKGDSTILDDTYNASPYATAAAIHTLKQFPGRKIAILGSMNELGDYEANGHRLVGKQCVGLDLLVTVGTAANSYLVEGATLAGLSADKIHEFNTPYEAGTFVAERLQPGDTVLAKGSQNGVFAEEAVKLLLANPQDAQKLVRQSEEWLAIKDEQFKN